MKLFENCEILRHHVRGDTAVVIAGDRAVTPAEGAALLVEYANSFGSAAKPIYFSRDGWQMLEGSKKGDAKPIVRSPAADQGSTTSGAA